MLCRVDQFHRIVKEGWSILKLSLGPSFFGPLGYHRWNPEQASPFEAVRTMDPKPELRLLDKVMKSVREIYPQCSQSRPVQTWAGMIDVMPDELCTVGALPDLPGLVLATGLSGHGLGLGPGIGMLAAQRVSGGTPQEGSECLDPFRFRSSVRSTSKPAIAAANRINVLFST